MTFWFLVEKMTLRFAIGQVLDVVSRAEQNIKITAYKSDQRGCRRPDGVVICGTWKSKEGGRIWKTP